LLAASLSEAGPPHPSVPNLKGTRDHLRGARMIYIFQLCGGICKAPCVCCQEVSKACNNCCKGCGTACDDCCKAISDCWAPIVQRPLGSFVIVTWVVMALVIACCAATIPNGLKPENKDICRDLVIFCLADIGLAIIHGAFALYMQRRLVSALDEQEGSSHSDIGKTLGAIMWRDIGFCLYFFVFFAAFGYNFYGIGEGRTCNDHGYSQGAVGLMLCFGVCTFWFGLCYPLGNCCFGKAKRLAKDVQPASVVGARQP